MMNEPGCDKYIRISPGFGFCEPHNKHVYLDEADSECLCKHCTADADGARVLDPDIFFREEETLGSRKSRAAKLQAMRDAAAVPSEHVNIKLPANSPLLKPEPVKHVKKAVIAKKPAAKPPAKKSPSLFDYRG
jgi:hypothetical protein